MYLNSSNLSCWIDRYECYLFICRFYHLFCTCSVYSNHLFSMNQWVLKAFSVDAGFLLSVNQWVYAGFFMGCESVDPVGLCRFPALCGCRFFVFYESVGLCSFSGLWIHGPNGHMQVCSPLWIQVYYSSWISEFMQVFCCLWISRTIFFHTFSSLLMQVCCSLWISGFLMSVNKWNQLLFLFARSQFSVDASFQFSLDTGFLFFVNQWVYSNFLLYMYQVSLVCY